MIARRLAGALIAILLVFAAAVLMMRISLGQIADAEDDVVAFDSTKHASQEVAATVREQFIHQAHLLNTFDQTHMAAYEQGVRETRAATERLVVLIEDADRKVAEQIDALARDSDRMFRERGLPAIAAADHPTVRDLSTSIHAIVDRVVDLTDTLVEDLDRRSKAAIRRAAEVRDRATLVSTVCFGLAFVLAAIVGTWLTRSIVRPVAALWRGARRVGAGDLTVRIPTGGAGELAQLAETFNQMTEDLKHNQAALVRSQKLAAIGQLAAGVAHEINNPLSVILGYAKLLGRRANAAEDREELQAIEDEAVQCQRIVQELLDFARPHQLQLSVVELGELARAAVEPLTKSCALANRTVRTPAEDAQVVAKVDEGRLRQVIANLVINAAQATANNTARLDLPLGPSATAAPTTGPANARRPQRR